MKSRNKVVVTGADGFIGSHLVEMLVDNGFSVKALSQYNSFNNWGWLDDIPCLDKIEVLTGDVRDPHFCNHITEDVDIVYHLAALIAIPYSYLAPDSYVDTNVKGTLNICQAARKNKVRHVVHTSTSEVYGTAQYVPIDEKHPIQPQSPYSATKIAADAIAMSFYNSLDLPVTIVRPFNTYGPRQSNRAIIPTVISQLLSKKKNIKVGNIYPKRDWTYVSDLCSAYYALYKSRKGFGKIYNVGTGNDHSISDMIKISQKICKTKKKIILEGKRKRPIKSEVNKLQCDSKFFKRDNHIHMDQLC